MTAPLAAAWLLVVKVVGAPLAPVVAESTPDVVFERLEVGEGVQAQVWLVDDTVVVWLDER